MQNEENIPLQIMDWLKYKTFAELRPEERATVLMWFSQEDYNDMQLAASFIENRNAGANNVKLNVLTHFDAVHRKGGQERQVLRHYWKIAAVLIPLLLFIAFFLLLRPITLNSHQSVARIDTVFVDKPVFARQESIHDTVWMPAKKAGKAQKKKEETFGFSHSGGSLSLGEVSGLEMDEEDLIQNVSRGNSLKDDSLLLLFPSVSL